MPKRTKVKPFTEAEWMEAFWLSMFRFPIEYHILRENKRPEGIDDSPLTKNIKRPRGWRLKIWKQLLATVFKELHDYVPDGSVESTGKIMGVFDQALNMLDRLGGSIAEDELAQLDVHAIVLDDELSQKADEKLEYLKALLNRDRFAKLVEQDRPQDIGNLYSGYGAGRGVLGNIDASGKMHFKKPTDATNAYLVLLFWGELLQKQSSVKAVHIVLESLLPKEFFRYSYESFSRLCNRIGFTCHSYARRKKQINRQLKKG